MNRPRAVRVNEAIVLVAGALFLVVMVAPDRDRFYWTPLVVGLSLLAAGAVAGRASGYWGPGSALVGWGAAVVFVRLAEPDLETSGVYLAGAGAGLLVACELGRRGFAVDSAVVAATIVLAGALLALTTLGGIFTDARTFAALLAGLALTQCVQATRHMEDRSTPGDAPR
jgi:hypothetical protein